jgi:hypothetical protein
MKAGRDDQAQMAENAALIANARERPAPSAPCGQPLPHVRPRKGHTLPIKHVIEFLRHVYIA